MFPLVLGKWLKVKVVVEIQNLEFSQNINKTLLDSFLEFLLLNFSSLSLNLAIFTLYLLADSYPLELYFVSSNLYALKSVFIKMIKSCSIFKINHLYFVN